MLIYHMTDFCNKNYNRSANVCMGCQHTEECSGGCKTCLEEIHYPTRYPNGKKDYDCANLLNFYMCDYSFKYASEMLYLLRKSPALKSIDDYHILSIGCGGCPDLMAFEEYVKETDTRKRIQYYGIDKNDLWMPIHEEIKNYAELSRLDMRAKFLYEDAIDYFNTQTLKETNVIVIQYLISHLYNTNQIKEIYAFYENLISNIIVHKTSNESLVILINDVNSCYRGRNYFENLCKKLSKAGLHGTYSMFYFDYNIKSDYQRYGDCHRSTDILFDIPSGLSYYEPWRQCSSAQMLIEVE